MMSFTSSAWDKILSAAIALGFSVLYLLVFSKYVAMIFGTATKTEATIGAFISLVTVLVIGYVAFKIAGHYLIRKVAEKSNAQVSKESFDAIKSERQSQPQVPEDKETQDSTLNARIWNAVNDKLRPKAAEPASPEVMQPSINGLDKTQTQILDSLVTLIEQGAIEAKVETRYKSAGEVKYSIGGLDVEKTLYLRAIRKETRLKEEKEKQQTEGEEDPKVEESDEIPIIDDGPINPGDI